MAVKSKQVKLSELMSTWTGPFLAVFVMLSVVMSFHSFDQSSLWQRAAAEAQVSFVSQSDVLDTIARGNPIIFVDARESAEYQEEHIPGAVNVVLRDVRKENVEYLNDKLMVIPYCLKDFRGFELAKALARAGVKNVYIMDNPGINGWKSEGLPTTGGKAGLSEIAALAKLAECAKSKTCMKGENT